MTQTVYGQRKKGPKPNLLARKNDIRDAICFIDVAFILDSSESSKIVLFDNQKDFVDSLSERIFQLTPGRSLKYDIRLAALQFSSSVQIDPPFSSWKDLPTFKQRVTSLNLIGQGTFSYYAISNATRLLKREGRKDGVKVALLMTDGIDHPKSPDVQSISEDARISGISFITVGLSTVVNEAKLRLISGDSSNEPVLLLSDPTLVDKIQERLKEEIIKLIIEICGCGPKCKETPLELVFVIDSSESVGPENFQIIQNFVKTLADRVALDLATARIGIINYSHKVEKVASLKQFSSKDDLKLAVDNMQYLGEGTYTATALQAANDMFKEARPGIKKVALVITDGQTDSRDKKKLADVVKDAKDSNVEIFVIGVVKKGDPNFEIFHQEMNLIATDPEHVYQFDDFFTLQDPRCEEALKPGNCGDYVVRWYYDKQVNSCARFWFSGCNGSGNRFHSERECQETCLRR
ncbi:Collagen alpha-1(XXVIII) chain [Cricetulus griseus]|uniref:Collagen alpha-1(XXVIII) chain n=1 Tax=Cricetulus griseus TaxID=10029 RepID=G3HJI1_CRIGR|nr:Collagen alpha-1(XXVIII) chain [Cricetulus griseus]